MRFAARGWKLEPDAFFLDRRAELITGSNGLSKSRDRRPDMIEAVPIFGLAKNPHGGHVSALARTPAAADDLGRLCDDHPWSAGELAAIGDIDGMADLDVASVPAALPLPTTAVGGLDFALHRRRTRA